VDWDKYTILNPFSYWKAKIIQGQPPSDFKEMSLQTQKLAIAI
jgi:hypothetical protein